MPFDPADANAPDATELAERVRRGETTPSELVAAAIERAEAVNPTINAITIPRYERALEQAAGEVPDGPFRGVPFAIKDLGLPEAGEPQHEGNRVLKEIDHRANRDSYLASKLRAAGLISIGRTNVPEFSSGNCPGSCETVAYGTTRNPWNLEHTAMGSSGGSSAAVAAGILPIAHANDGGGSTRIPASANGLVGLKATRGRVSVGPDLGEGWAGGSMDGMVTRSVRDAATALDVISGAMPGDPYYAPPPSRPFASEPGADPGSLRIGLCPALPGRPIHDECRAAVEATGKLLEARGHRVELSHPVAMEEDILTPYFEVVCVHTAWELDAWARVIGRPWTEDDMEEGTWAAYQDGLALGGLAYVTGLTNLHAFSRRMADWWATGFDILVTPTLAAPPPRLGFLIDLEKGWDRVVDLVQCTPQFNVTGQPAISLPLHWTADGLPVGVQLVGPYAGEALLLRLSAQLEAAAPWSHRRPPAFAD